MNQDNEVLVKVDRVSKKFCRDLKKSLWYGVKDVASELLPFSSNKEPRTKNQEHSPSLRPGEFWANKNISFELRRGECIGLIGHNGAGKTTLLKMLNGLIKPDSGTIEMRGRVGALIALGAGFNPILTGRENIYVNGSVLGLTKGEIDAKIDDIIEFSEIGEFIDSPVQSYSSGMTVRLGFAVATAMNPDILILDEVLAVGDGNFRSKCIKRIGNILTKSAVIFVSHDSYQVRRICDKVLWLKRGEPLFFGDTETGMERYTNDALKSGSEINAMINIDKCISDLRHDVKYGFYRNTNGQEIGNIVFDISFNSTEPIKLGMRMGNIVVTGETAIAQCDLNTSMEYIKTGKNNFHFHIPNIQLARGTYTFGIIVYDETNKRLLLNLRNFVEFSVKGNIRYGPHYALEAISIKH